MKQKFVFARAAATFALAGAACAQGQGAQDQKSAQD